jgi:sorting nexin-1/2
MKVFVTTFSSSSFQERIKAWQHWQTATATLTKKREAKARAELQQRLEKLPSMRQEIMECERQQELAQENFEKISRLIKKEVEMFDKQRCHEFKLTLVKYMQSMLKAQEEVANIWEGYLPQVQGMNNHK